jgi:hypothetical protein
MVLSFAAIIGFVGLGGWFYLDVYLSQLLPQIAQAMLVGTATGQQSMAKLVEDAPLFTFLAASVPILLLLWLLRYPSKIFMMAAALKADADHRTAMTKAYLALAKQPVLVRSDREVELILQALFRPGPADAQDVTPHQSFMSALGQLISKKPH